MSNCINCNLPLLAKKEKYKFCSNSCQQSNKIKSIIELWLNDGITPGPKTIRNYLLSKFDNKCSQCGWSEINPFSGRITLEVEHIDGNSENNILSNLTILCPNCHSLTRTFRALNRGNGRFARRQRYSAGKSF